MLKTFTLVGYWDYDELMPVHYINISRDYADDIGSAGSENRFTAFRTDLNVMLASSTNIQGQMEQVDTDLGYTWDICPINSVRIGVNWDILIPAGVTARSRADGRPKRLFLAGDFHGVSYHL